MIVLIMGFLKWLGLVDQTVTPPPPAKTARSGSDVFLVVVDASPSMSECDMNGSSRYAVATDAIEAMSKKIEQAYPDALVGVVVFWADARVEMPLQRITTSFWKKLQGLKQKSDFGWGTSLGWGLKTAYATLGAYSHIPKRQIIALTDGHSNGGVDGIRLEAHQAFAEEMPPQPTQQMSTTRECVRRLRRTNRTGRANTVRTQTTRARRSRPKRWDIVLSRAESGVPFALVRVPAYPLTHSGGAEQRCSTTTSMKAV